MGVWKELRPELKKWWAHPPLSGEPRRPSFLEIKRRLEIFQQNFIAA